MKLRTKRWMHQKAFSKCFLFYPEVTAAECLPQGLPAGKVCAKFPMFNQAEKFMILFMSIPIAVEFAFSTYYILKVFASSSLLPASIIQDEDLPPLKLSARRRPSRPASVRISSSTPQHCETPCMAWSVQQLTWRIGWTGFCQLNHFLTCQRCLAFLLVYIVSDSCTLMLCPSSVWPSATSSQKMIHTELVFW